MTRVDRILIALAAFSGFLSVAFGAVAAHNAPDVGAERLLATGATWQAAHALATMVAIGLLPRARVVAGLFLGGSFLFSTSLYLLAFVGIAELGWITPAGGLLMLAGWVWLAVSALRGGDA